MIGYYIRLQLAYCFFMVLGLGYQLIKAVKIRRWATVPPFLVPFFGFYQSVFRDNTFPVIGGDMTIGRRINFKWYLNGQPKERV